MSPLTCHLSTPTSHLSPPTSQLSPLTSHLSPVTPPDHSHLPPLNLSLSPLTSHVSPSPLTLTSHPDSDSHSQARSHSHSHSDPDSHMQPTLQKQVYLKRLAVQKLELSRSMIPSLGYLAYYRTNIQLGVFCITTSLRPHRIRCAPAAFRKSYPCKSAPYKSFNFLTTNSNAVENPRKRQQPIRAFTLLCKNP